MPAAPQHLNTVHASPWRLWTGLTLCSSSHTFLSQPGPQNPTSPLHNPLPGTGASVSGWPSQAHGLHLPLPFQVAEECQTVWGAELRRGQKQAFRQANMKLGLPVSAPGHRHKQKEKPQSGSGTGPLGSSICPTQAAGPEWRVFGLEQARYPGAPCITSSHPFLY